MGVAGCIVIFYLGFFAGFFFLTAFRDVQEELQEEPEKIYSEPVVTVGDVTIKEKQYFANYYVRNGCSYMVYCQ